MDKTIRTSKHTPQGSPVQCHTSSSACIFFDHPKQTRFAIPVMPFHGNFSQIYRQAYDREGLLSCKIQCHFFNKAWPSLHSTRTYFSALRPSLQRYPLIHYGLAERLYRAIAGPGRRPSTLSVSRTPGNALHHSMTASQAVVNRACQS